MRSHSAPIAIVAFFLSITFCISDGFCKVTGSLKQDAENHITINLKMTAPAPDTCIVTLDIPDGVKITDAAPAVSRLDAKKNQAQWLLKDVKTGDHKIEVGFDKKVEAKGLKVIVRYKDMKTGNMVEETVR